MTAKFGFILYVDNTVAFSPDAAPTVASPPSPSRVFRTTRTMFTGATAQKLVVVPKDGTTMSVRAWVLEETPGGFNEWFPIDASAAAATPTVPAFITIPDIPNAKLFVQITANTLVTKFGAFIG